MITPKIENLIVKYVTRSATSTDLDTLAEWINTSSNREVFKDYAQTHYAITFSMNNPDANQIKARLLRDIQKDKSVFYKYKLLSVFKYAAVVILFLGIGYLYQTGYFSSEATHIVPSENITLQLENGDIKIIAEDGSTKVVDKEGNIVGVQSGNQLVYSSEIEKETLVYNTLTVPYGKRFEIQLSDGTNVHLNAGTSLKYPVNFIKGENRHVFLDGEAYFDVTEDKNRSFIVNADEINIRVLGTQFNTSSYPGDLYINTVLVEGSVSIYNKEEMYSATTSTLLLPGYIAAWDKDNKKIAVNEADIESHTAWINGRLILNEVQFNDILKKLERQYNVTFINNYKDLESRYLTARFDVEDIYQIMESFSNSISFTYVINEKQIIINP